MFSAMIWPKSKTAQAFYKAASKPNTGMVCFYSVEELLKTIKKKAPQYLYSVDKFLCNTVFSLIFVPVPFEKCEEEEKIRDEKDRPLLRAAIRFGAEYFLTGDKDFLESGVKNPKIINVSDFLDLELI